MDIPDNILKYMYNLKPKDVIGSFEFMDRNERTFYSRTGIIKENSEFQGVDKEGNYIYKSVLGDPTYASALMLGTYNNYNNLVTEEDKEKSVLNAMAYALWQPISSFFDMGIGQGIGKQVSANKSLEDKAMQLVQVGFLDIFEAFNADFIKKPLQYVDGKLRPNQSIKDFIKEDGTFVGGTGDYVVNKVFPVYVSYYSAMKAPQAYGMFGEELYRVPAQDQGALSAALFKYAYSDKNKDQKSMYDWLALNGYKQIWKAPKEFPLYNDEQEMVLIKKSKMNNYGMVAGRRSFDEIKSKMVELQAIRLGEEDREKGEGLFKDAINDIMRDNFTRIFYEGEGVITPDIASRMDSRESEEDEVSKEASEIKAENLAELEQYRNPTKEEKDFNTILFKNPSKKSFLTIQKVKAMSNNDKELFIDRLLELGSISEKVYNEVRNDLDLGN